MADQMIVYPTDFGLVATSRQESERIIDVICEKLTIEQNPRTYRRNARKAYLELAKKKHKTKKEIRKEIGAYYLKEELGQLWLKTSKQEAATFLTSWATRAWATTIVELRTFVKTLLAHRTGILNWFDYRISTGPLEGLNNKIKVLKRKAYGFRDMEYFALKIYALHENRYGLL